MDIYEADGYVESTGFTDDYPADANCQYNLHQPEGSSMTVELEALNLVDSLVGQGTGYYMHDMIVKVGNSVFNKPQSCF